MRERGKLATPPQETAVRFAHDVIDEPKEGLTATYNNDPGDAGDYRRYDVNSPENDAGSERPGVAVYVRKYGRCWFVVGSEPGDNWSFPSIAYGVSGADEKLIVRPEGDRLSIGYGPMEDQLAGRASQAVIDIAQLEPDAIGHVISGQTAMSLGFVPPMGTTPLQQLTLEEIEAAPDVATPKRFTGIHTRPWVNSSSSVSGGALGATVRALWNSSAVIPQRRSPTRNGH